MEHMKNQKVSTQQLAAKKYIEENEIEKLVSEMLNSLVHEKSKQPIVYMIKYLAGLLSEEERRTHGLVIPDPYPKGRPIPIFPEIKNTNPNCLLKRHLTKSVWSQIKYSRTKHEGTIAHMMKLSENATNDPVGCLLTDSNCLSTFSNFLGPIMLDQHKYTSNPESETEKYRPKKEFKINNSLSTNENFPFYERNYEGIVDLKLSYSRNIQDTSFSPILNKEKRFAVENTILKAINQMLDDKTIPQGKFLNFKDNENEINNLFKEMEYNLDFLLTAGVKMDWPDNRHCFTTEDNQIVILINFLDHLQIIIRPRKGVTDNQFVKIYNDGYTLLKSFEKYLHFEFDKFYGYVNCYPLLIGAGLEISSKIKLDNLSKFSEFSNKLANMNFDFVEITDNILKTRSYCKLSCESDLEFCEDYYSKISGLLNLDKSDDINDWINLPHLNLSESNCPSIKKAYDENYSTLQNVLAPSGQYINSLVKVYNNYPELSRGILLSENYDYKIFKKFVRDYLLQSQNFDLFEFDHIHKPDEQKDPEALKINDHSGKLIDTKVTLIRNVSGFPFACSKNNKNSEVNEMIKKVVERLKLKGIIGDYVEFDSDEYVKLKEEFNLNIAHSAELEKLGIQSDFPQNRALIHFEKDNIFAFVNDLDHLKLKIVISDDQLQAKFIQLLKLSNEFSKGLNFSYDKCLGFLTACPNYLGTGMTIRTKLKLTNLVKDEDKVLNIVNAYCYNYKILDTNEGIIEVFNKFTIGRSETDLLVNLIDMINKLIESDSA